MIWSPVIIVHFNPECYQWFNLLLEVEKARWLDPGWVEEWWPLWACWECAVGCWGGWGAGCGGCCGGGWGGCVCCECGGNNSPGCLDDIPGGPT